MCECVTCTHTDRHTPHIHLARKTMSEHSKQKTLKLNEKCLGEYVRFGLGTVFNKHVVVDIRQRWRNNKTFRALLGVYQWWPLHMFGGGTIQYLRCSYTCWTRPEHDYRAIDNPLRVLLCIACTIEWLHVLMGWRVLCSIHESLTSNGRILIWMTQYTSRQGRSD